MTYRLIVEDSNHDKIVHLQEYATEIGLTNNILTMSIEVEEEVVKEK